MLEKLRSLIEEQTGKADIGASTRLDSLGIDSLEFLSLMLEIQREFDRIIPDSEWPNLHTVGDILERLA